MKSLKLNLILLVGALLSTALVASTASAQEDICVDFFTCLDACGEEDADCVEQCVMGADPAVAEAFINVVGCELGTECAEDDDACFEDACGAEYEALDGACFGENPDIPCFDFLACIQNCEETDTACLVACNEQSEDPAEQAAIGDFLNCAINSGCELIDEPEDEQCLEDACPEEIAAFSEVCAFDDVANNGDNNGDDPIGSNNGDNNGDVVDDNNGAGNNGDRNDGAGNNGDGEENGADGGSDSDEDSGCAVAPSQGGNGGAVMLLLLGLVALGLRRRA